MYDVSNCRMRKLCKTGLCLMHADSWSLENGCAICCNGKMVAVPTSARAVR